MIDAVVFDLDGVLVQSEEIWDGARRELAAEAGIDWPPGATEAMMGMSSREWSRYMASEVGVPSTADEIDAGVLARVEERYRRDVPWIPGAREAVERMAARWPLGLATSSNREIVELVLETGRLGDAFAATVSSEEVGAGKPEPAVYLEATRRLGVDPRSAAAVEDSTNGLLAAAAAGMRVIAIPNAAHPPDPSGLEVAHAVLESIDELDPAVVAGP